VGGGGAVGEEVREAAGMEGRVDEGFKRAVMSREVMAVVARWVQSWETSR
jgi:hypothetical protein